MWQSETVTLRLDGTIHPWPQPDIGKLVTSSSMYSPDGSWLTGDDRQDAHRLHAPAQGDRREAFDSRIVAEQAGDHRALGEPAEDHSGVRAGRGGTPADARRRA